MRRRTASGAGSASRRPSTSWASLLSVAKSRRGKFLLKRKTRRDRMRAKLQAIKQELRQRRHQPIPVQGKWLRQVVKGYFNYHAVPTNSRALAAFRFAVTHPRWEPYAGKPHVRFCAGGAQQ